MEVLAGLEAARLEQRRDPLPRRARVRGRLEHDQLALLEARRDLARRVEQDRQVGLALGRERRRQRDEDRVGARAARRSRSSRVTRPASTWRLQHLRGHVLDVALAAVQLRDAVGLDVDQHDGVARVREDASERHADVAGPDDGDRAHDRPKGIERLSDPRGRVSVAVELRARPAGTCAASSTSGRRPGSSGSTSVFAPASDGVHPFGRGPQRHAGHAQPVGLLLQAARVGDDGSRARRRARASRDSRPGRSRAAAAPGSIPCSSSALRVRGWTGKTKVRPVAFRLSISRAAARARCSPRGGSSSTS